MTRSFKLPRWTPAGSSLNIKDPRFAVRAAVIVLLAANLVAALIYFKPWGGSAEDLARQRTDLRQELANMQARLARTRSLVDKAGRASTEGNQFLTTYMTDRRTTFSTIYAELERAAKEAGIHPKPSSFEYQQVEGSDNLYQLTISAGYEGTYANLVKFVNLLDKSPRFLIIESLQAAPQSANTGDVLGVSFKMDTFIRELPGSAS